MLQSAWVKVTETRSFIGLAGCTGGACITVWGVASGAHCGQKPHSRAATMWVTLTKGAKRNPGQGTPQADQLLSLLLLVVAGTVRDRNFCLILSGILFRLLAHVAPGTAAVQQVPASVRAGGPACTWHQVHDVMQGSVTLFFVRLPMRMSSRQWVTSPPGGPWTC